VGTPAYVKEKGKRKERPGAGRTARASPFTRTVGSRVAGLLTATHGQTKDDLHQRRHQGGGSRQLALRAMPGAGDAVVPGPGTPGPDGLYVPDAILQCVVKIQRAYRQKNGLRHMKMTRAAKVLQSHYR
jgi:hypothetical protein